MAEGMGGQVAMVVPDANAVVVSMGQNSDPSHAAPVMFSALCKALFQGDCPPGPPPLTRLKSDEGRPAQAPDPGHVLADAKRAFNYAHAHITQPTHSKLHPRGFSCNWERATYMLGLWNYFAVSQDADAGQYLQAWGQNYNYKLCAETNHSKKPHHHPGCPSPTPPPQLPTRRRLQGACEHDTLPCVNEHNANNQLCGATYLELGKAGLAPRAETIADTKRVFAAEMASPSSTNFWSWLDAAFMAMNTWSRLAEVESDPQYYEKQWANFEAAMLLPANGDGESKGTQFGFWNTSQHLFYRDDCYVHR